MSNKLSILKMTDARYGDVRDILLKETKVSDFALIRQQDGLQSNDLLLVAGPAQLSSSTLYEKVWQQLGSLGLARVIHVTALPRKEGALDLGAIASLLTRSAPETRCGEVMVAEPPHCGRVAAVDSRPAMLTGNVLPADPHQRQSLGDALRVAVQSGRGIRFIDEQGDVSSLSYAQLMEQAGQIAAALLAWGADIPQALVLQTCTLADTVLAAWSGWLAGIPVVPLPMSEAFSLDDVNGSKLKAVLNSLSGVAVLCNEQDKTRLQDAVRSHYTAGVEVVSLSALRQASATAELPMVNVDQVALYLMTSGSTAEPKLVAQTHGRILSRSRACQKINGFTPDDISLNWLPLDHVGGIVMFHLQDVVSGCDQIQVPTRYILQDPLRWMDLCSAHQVTLTWAPNFAFELVNSKARQMSGHDWQLNPLRFILNGGEAIVARQAHQFLQNLAPFGLPSSAMTPSWGMSETCSGVAFDKNFLTTPADAPYTSTGQPVPGIALRVVDEQGSLKRYGEKGHLQIKGDSVFTGYLGHEPLAAPTFSADGWFNTGDLAQIGERGISIVGRDKDLVIINGRNIAFHEIEACIGQIPGVDPANTCVFIDRQRTEQLCVVIASQHEGDDLTALMAGIRTRVRESFSLAVDRLYCLLPEQISKSSIGKIQRNKVQQTIQTLALSPRWINSAVPPKQTIDAHCFQRQWKPLPGLRYGKTLRNVALVCPDPCLASSLPGMLAGQGVNFLPVAPDESDHQVWVSALQQVQILGSQVDHLLFIASTQEQGTLKQQYQALLAPLIGLLQGWQEVKCTLPMTVVMLDDPTANPLDSMVISLIRSAREEIPHFQGRVMTLDKLTPDSLAGLVSELDCAVCDIEVAWRNGQRYVSRLSRLPASDGMATRNLRHKAVLVGGLGGAGFILAQHLAKESDAPIWLLGRTPADRLSSESLLRLARLRELSAQIRYKAVDVTDYPALSDALVQINEDEGGRIGTLYNLAGNFAACAIHDINTATDFAQLDCKVIGSSHLYSLAKELAIPSLILFSSANGYLSGAGVALYSAANRYQEALAEQARQVEVISLGWSMLNDTGLSRGLAIQSLTEAKGYQILQPESAIPALFWLNTAAAPACVIGLNAQAPALWQEFWFTPALMPDARQPAAWQEEKLTTVTADGAQRGVAPAIAAIWQKLLDLDDLDWDENLFDMGANSLLLPQVTLQVEQQLGVRLSLVELFQYPTVSMLAGFIAPQCTHTAPADAVEDQLMAFWQETLDIDDFSTDENVFDIGANSLLLPQLQQYINARFKQKVTLVELFQYPSVATLAAFISGKTQA